MLLISSTQSPFLKDLNFNFHDLCEVCGVTTFIIVCHCFPLKGYYGNQHKVQVQFPSCVFPL